MNRKPVLPVEEELNLDADKADLLNSHTKLTRALRAFTDAVRLDADLPAHFEGGLSGIEARQRAIKLYQSLLLPSEKERAEWGTDEDDVTIKGRGVLGASPDTILALDALNSAKKDFASVISEISGHVQVKGSDYPVRISRKLLDDMFGKRFSWRQSVRPIINVSAPKIPKDSSVPVVPFLRNADVLAYTYATTRSIRWKAVAEVRGMLRERVGSEGAHKALEALAGLHPDDPLACIIPSAGHWRINAIWHSRSDADARMQVMHTTAIPVIVPVSGAGDFPVIRHLDSDPKADRKAVVTRPANEKIEPEPLIKAFHIYRYRPDAAKQIAADKDWIEHLAKIRRLSRGDNSR